ncbi:MAG TPA: SGNH/GDSL hydrolase family protein, partial [Microlunatus sp.]|nr:SGNH/GDSL hydrolase family protein [Microlunatus sp.]
IADAYDLPLDYQACSGAVTADVRSNQLGALNSGTSHVTLTIGGNDAGFADVLTECALPGWLSDCEGAIADGLAVIENELPGRYDDLFTAVGGAAPNAVVAVGGYPRLFNGEDCNAGTFFSPGEQAALNAGVDTLNTLLADKAAAHDFSYVDPRGAFAGHAVCDDTEWINGLSYPIEESYHPNRDGNRGYAALLGPVLTGTPFAPTVLARRAAADRPSRSLAPTPREEAEAVLSFDLDSPANLAAAERHGIAPNEIERLARMLRSDDLRTVRQALRSLQRLDRAVSAGPAR